MADIRYPPFVRYGLVGNELPQYEIPDTQYIIIA